MMRCFYQLCLEIKYIPEFYHLKSELVLYLRREHEKWWKRYDDIYKKGLYITRLSGSKNGWDYSSPAKEMLTRCRIYDNLYERIVGIDLFKVEDFGQYCKTIFSEINRLRPAFPDSSMSQLSFDQTARELRKYVMMQSNGGFMEELPPAASAGIP
jgi:hypothetical protein